MLIAKIVSGGQTGVDRGAIEAALERGFPYGGLIPKGRLAEDGQVPLVFTAMEESARKDYIFRTEWNVVHSDATILITNHVPLSGGTKRTADFCEKHTKPYLILVWPFPTQCGHINKAHDWMLTLSHDILHREELVINVAGPRESKANGIQKGTREFVSELIGNERLSQAVIDSLSAAAKSAREKELKK